MNLFPDTASRAESPDTVRSAKCQREGKECVCVCVGVCARFMVQFIDNLVTTDFDTDLNAELAKSAF